MKNVLLLLFLSLMWASVYLFIKIAGQSLLPVTIVAGRGLFGALFFITTLLIMRHSWWHYFQKKYLRHHLIWFLCACLIAYYWLSMVIAEQHITAGLAALLSSSIPIFSYLFTIFYLRVRQFYVKEFIGILIAALGIGVMLNLPSIFQGHLAILYMLYLLSGFFAFVLSSVIKSKYLKQTPILVDSTFTIFYVGLLVFIIAMWHDHPWDESYHVLATVSVILAGLICSGASYLIFFYLNETAGIGFTSYFGYLVPIFALILACLLTHEKIVCYQVLGIAIVFTGIGFSQPKRKPSG